MKIEAGTTKHDLLCILGNPAQSNLSQHQLREILGLKSQSAVSQHLQELEDAGFIEIVPQDNYPDLKELTREGWKAREEAPGGNGPIQEGDDGDGPAFLHKFFLKFKIRNPHELDDGWRERWCQGKPVRKRYMPDAGAYAYFKDNWRFRVTSEHVLVHLSELRGHDATHLKNRALVEAFEAVRWLEKQAPVKVVKEPSELEIWVNQAEMGVIAHPFALLVDRYSSMALDDVKVYDDSGRERYKLDASHGPELEAPSREFHEEDIQLEIDRLEAQAENPDRHRWIYEDMPEEFDELGDRVEKLERENRELREMVERLVTAQEKQTRKLKEVSGNQSGIVENLKLVKENMGGRREAPGMSQINLGSVWRDRWGNLMGYDEERGKPVKLKDAEEVDGLNA